MTMPMLFRGSWRRRSPLGLEQFQTPIATAPRLLTALMVATASATPARPAAPEPVPSSQTLIVTAQDNGSSLILRQGETLKVVLSGNAGTGYGWDLEHHDPSQIEPLGMESRQAPGPPLPDGRSLPLAGGPQQISFLFRMLRPGRSTLKLRYWRPWEGASSIIERFRLRVVIVPPQAAD
jgi:predicted secreted protein